MATGIVISFSPGALGGLCALLATACGGDVRGAATERGDGSTGPTIAVDGGEAGPSFADARAIHDGGSDAHGRGPDACQTTIDAYCAGHPGCISEWPADPTALCASKQYVDVITVGEVGGYDVAAITSVDYGRYWVFDKGTGRLVEIVDSGGQNTSCVAGPGTQLPLQLSFQEQAVDCISGGSPTPAERACLSASVPDGGLGLGCKVRGCYRVTAGLCNGAGMLGMLCPALSPTPLPFHCIMTTLGPVEIGGVVGAVRCCLP